MAPFILLYVCNLSRGIKVAASPLDSPCDGPVTHPGDNKHYS